MDTSNTRNRPDTDTEIQMPEPPKAKRKRASSKKPNGDGATKATLEPRGSLPLAAVPIADLRRAFGRLASIVDVKSSMPLLHRVRVVSHGGVARLAATDLNTSMLIDLDCQTHESMGVVVDCRRVRDLLRVMPDGDVTLSYDKGAFAALSAGRCNAKVEAISDRDFPTIPEHDGDWHTVDAGALRSMIDDVLPTVCHDETRFHLNGALLESADGERITMVSTDGHRLTKTQRFTKTSFVSRSVAGNATGFIVPERALKELRKNLTDGTVKIAQSKTHVFVKQGEWTLVTKPIDAQFPPYGQVIPTEHKVLVTVAKDALIEACKRSKVFSSETRGVLLKLTDGALSLRSDDPDAGELVETMDADYGRKGEGLVYGINATFLRSAVEALEGDSVVISVQAELDPILIRSIDDAAMRKLGDAELLVVVMPMRV